MKYKWSLTKLIVIWIVIGGNYLIAEQILGEIRVIWGRLSFIQNIVHMSNLAFHNDLSLNLLSGVLYMMAPITPFGFNGLLYGLFDPLSFSSQLFKHQSVLDQFTWQFSYWWTSVTLSSSSIVSILIPKLLLFFCWLHEMGLWLFLSRFTKK